MAHLPASSQAFELPKLRTTLKAGPENPHSDDNLFWDVKFFPFETSPGADPTFAIVNQTNILVCQISADDENPVSILRVLATEAVGNGDSTGCLNSCCWAFISQSEPLLVAAGDSGLLQVFDVLKGNLLTTLVSHGRGTINDVATHPMYPWIVASASMDSSIRIWDLRRWDHKHKSPCVIICGHNNGHKEGILTVSWHESGRYIVTGGHDHRICVWTVPDLAPESTFWDEISPSQRKRSSDEIRIIHYPHFVSSGVHSNYVDCACFYGDDIISKAAEEFKAVLWRITGFNSRLPPPDSTTAPKTEEHLETRNGFTRTTKSDPTGVKTIHTNPAYESQPPYQRLLNFDAPNCKSFYMRFGFLQPTPLHPDLHPVLALGNNASQIFFWDLERLELGHDGGLKDHHPEGDKFRVPARKKKGMARPLDRLSRLASVGGQTSTTQDTATASSPTSSRRSSSAGTGTGPFDQASAPPSHAASVATLPPSLLSSSNTYNNIGNDNDNDSSNLPHPPAAPPGLIHRQSSPSTSIIATIETLPTTLMLTADRSIYPLSDPHRPLKAHAIIPLGDFPPRYHPFTARAADWSKCGRWCVVAGQATEQNGGVVAGVGVAALFGRW